jgi:Mg2+ and Co2+ transporter CorA
MTSVPTGTAGAAATSPPARGAALQLEAITRWRPGLMTERLRSIPAAAKAFDDPGSLLWFEWMAPRHPLQAADTGPYLRSSYDHTELLRHLREVGACEKVAPTERERCQVRMAALEAEERWLGQSGLWVPGTHWKEGVITTSAVAPAPPEILEIFDAKCGFVLGSMSFVVFPRCLVTIRWRPRLTLQRALSPEEAERVSAAWKESRFVFYESAERFRNTVETAWRERSVDRDAGDLAVLAIGGLAKSFAPAMRSLARNFHDIEAHGFQAAMDAVRNRDGRAGATPIAGTDGAVHVSLEPSFLELLSALAEFQLDVDAVRDYTGPMYFVRDEPAREALGRLYDDTLQNLRNVRADLRASLDAIGSVNSAMMLAITQEQQALAREQQRLAAEQERAAQLQQKADENRRDRIDLLTALLVPPALIATIYGANVKLPGNDEWTGTAVLALLIVIATLLTVLILRRTRNAASDRAAR